MAGSTNSTGAELDPGLRSMIERVIEELIALLDQFDGDPDFEPSFDFVVPGHVDEAEIDEDFETAV